MRVDRNLPLHVAEMGPQRAAIRVVLHPEGVSAIKVDHAADHLGEQVMAIGVFIDGSNTTHCYYSHFAGSPGACAACRACPRQA